MRPRRQNVQKRLTFPKYILIVVGAVTSLWSWKEKSERGFLSCIAKISLVCYLRSRNKYGPGIYRLETQNRIQRFTLDTEQLYHLHCWYHRRQYLPWLTYSHDNHYQYCTKYGPIVWFLWCWGNGRRHRIRRKPDWIGTAEEFATKMYHANKNPIWDHNSLEQNF